jgi:hypothetical protein
VSQLDLTHRSGARGGDGKVGRSEGDLAMQGEVQRRDLLRDQAGSDHLPVNGSGSSVEGSCVAEGRRSSKGEPAGEAVPADREIIVAEREGVG